MTETVWKMDGTGIMRAGDVGGDIQAGEAYSVRFLHTSLYGRMIEVTAYPVRGDGTTLDIPDGVIRLQVQTELMVCTDTDDPGSSEVWSDIEYSDLPEMFDVDYASTGIAENSARLYLAQLDPAMHFTWDGKPEMGPASVLKYAVTMGTLSGPIPGKDVVSYVQDITLQNNNFEHPAIILDWWFEVVTDPQGSKWRVAWLMDVSHSNSDGPGGGWVIGVYWEPIEPRHTHYDPYGPPRQVPGTLLSCDDVVKHDPKDSELWADYRYSPRLERSGVTGLPAHVERDVLAAYMANRQPDVVWAITDADEDEEYTYRVRITNRTGYSLDESGPAFHTEEWGLHPHDGQWHGIPINPHPGYEHWPAFCPNCGW